MEENLKNNLESCINIHESNNGCKDILKELFPNLFINQQEINYSYLLNVLIKEKNKYQLTWYEKEKCLNNIKLNCNKILCPEFESGVLENNARHFFIEGDNLEVLQILQTAYSNKIKVIYIDPPYNTGQLFVYSDNFKNKKIKNSKDVMKNRQVNNYHDNWLSMIYPRLKVAKNLLTLDGIIFVSIDDNEIHNLRILLDEIFGAENYCGTIKRRAARKNTFLSKCMSDLFDYIVIYSKNSKLPFLGNQKNTEVTRPVFNEGNKNSIRDVHKGTVAKCPDGIYKAGIYKTRSIHFEILNDMIIKNSVLDKSIKVKGPWRINQNILNSTIFITKNNGFRRNVLQVELSKKSVMNDFLDNSDCYNEKGSEELKHLFNNQKGIFNNPKPTGLIEYLLKSVQLNENDYILDFFAGSGSTLHSILKMNASGHYNLNSISIQNAEKSHLLKVNFGFNSIYELAVERNRRAIEKILKDNSKCKNINNIGFKCFKIVDQKIFKLLSYSEAVKKSTNYRDNIISNHRRNLIWDIIFLEKLSLEFKFSNNTNDIKNDFYLVIDEPTNKILLIYYSEKNLDNSLKNIEHIHEKFSSWKIVVILPVLSVNLKQSLIQKLVTLYNVKFYEDVIH
ncbi:site-specific DNA-methyltransferase [Pigmentibacter sp. JX0631]|uniref:site-specific DNA-methyltransferase n=1 Tax=Pigmentibacter sp. JX0631 TaxID=2976982 RepID=UPI002468C09C|nr:site-specific DNA-methyltransferase [Pigmentibacter sp. JX0631]WGL60096.1 site-specific DNA-methyltransferase [Pigmentibacter sp. JX0631]